MAVTRTASTSMPRIPYLIVPKLIFYSRMDLLPASWIVQVVGTMLGVNTCFVQSAGVAHVSTVLATYMKAGVLRETTGYMAIPRVYLWINSKCSKIVVPTSTFRKVGKMAL